MLAKGVEYKFLKHLYRRYLKEFGPGLRNLEASAVLITYGRGIESEIPELHVIKHGIMHSYLVVEAATELEQLGYAKFSDDHTKFWLTESGYAYASQGWFSRQLQPLNKNPGIAIIISACFSLLSLIVSIIALRNK